MSTLRSFTVKAPKGNDKKFGSRNDNRLSSAFPNSPLPSGKNEYSEDLVRKISDAVFLGNAGDEIDAKFGILDGKLSDGGYMFGLVDLNYSDSPDMLTVKTGGGGLPSSPWVPNLASATGGIPSNQPEYLGPLPNKHVGYGVGKGGTLSPSETSKQISSNKIGDWVLGPVAGSSKSG